MAAPLEIVHERAYEPFRREPKLRLHTAPAATSTVYAASGTDTTSGSDTDSTDSSSDIASHYNTDHAAASAR